LVPEGENSKSLSMAAQIYSQLIRAGADRDSVIVAFGGGVIGDLAGFVAATYLRGVRLVHIPTTLLAQIDSSIGGKVGVNHPLGKNLIGAFHQPSLVMADTRLLQTLPPREWRSGIFEALKYGVIGKPELFSFLESRAHQLGRPEITACTQIVKWCTAIKARIVSRDERESRLRMVLNLGHTVGHALESVTGYAKLTHGEAVGWGMLFAVQYAEGQGILKASSAIRIKRLIALLGLPPLPSLRANQVLAAMQQDKKRSGQSLRLVLPVRIGKVDIVEVCDVDGIKQILIASGIAS
jgi:3-dehydroquinate synthase